MRDPFPLADLFNFSSDNRTRLMLFGINLDLLPSENSSAVTARAEDAQINVYPLIVEYAGPVSSLAGTSEVVVRLPDNLPAAQDIFVSVTLRGQTSNKVRFRMQ